MARKDLFERVGEARDVLVQLRLRTNVARKAMRKLRGLGLIAVEAAGDQTYVGFVESVTLIESLGDDVARAEKRGREVSSKKTSGKAK